ncbi:hypothetical protein [Sphingomonas melonis]|uniref:hypothetical protein n=1 Tax=Sphingomonas melonis TaxID=152682 RepID=UPI0035C851F1
MSHLWTIAAALGAILNGILTYETASNHEGWKKTAVPALSCVGFLILTVHRAGLVDLSGLG